MKFILLSLQLLLAMTLTIEGFAQPADSIRIDEIVEADHRKRKITPNPPASDEVFLRRVYLDVLGRIPTRSEADSFLDAQTPNKRALLIDHLLDSDGRVSHDFNYWADILRIQSRMQGEAGGAYSGWVKQALADNVPYDEFVKSMITAEGYIWDNGAVGYYLRDNGMPLDNMSNTTQIFLGTQLVCAQCHNHPFDKWQQKDYYAMAAFTYGVQTRVNPEKELGISKIIDRNKKRSRPQAMSANTRRALNDILEPLSYGATETPREIKLPTDYQYDDGFEPGQVVKPNPILGGKIRLRGKDSPRDGYAAWLTDSQNPRFTRVIANRLWKRAFGIGLIEPVDDFRDDTEASNPALMKYLEDQMRSKGYDMKRFMRMVYNTRTYQRASTTEPVPSDQPYYFSGPLLRRMSAEQLWDSIITLTIPSPDKRKGVASYSDRQLQAKARADRLKERAERNPREILEQAQRIGAAMDQFEADSKKIRFEILIAQEDDDQKLVRELRAKQRDAEKLRDKTIREINLAADQFMGSMSMMAGSMMQDKKQKGDAVGSHSDQWKDFNGDLVRASELPSPAPDGHFLREFGQSDRETIQNSNADTSVAQALGLLNGTITDDVLSDVSVVMKEVKASMSAEEKRDALFLSILGRQADSEEIKTFDNYVAEAGDKAYENLIWALLNTAEFSFVQ